MHKLLRKGGYKRLMPLLLLFLTWSTRLLATPACPIITGTFPEANGTTVDASSTGWYIDATKVVSSSLSIFSVKSNRFTAQNIGGEGIWYSRVFSTAGYSSFQAAVKISSEGKQNSSEYVKIYYKLDGGPETLLDQRTGNFGTIDFTSDSLHGSTIQLIVKMYDYDNGSGTRSDYYIEGYRVFKEKGPCGGGTTVSVTAGASNSGILTCTNPSTTLSASSSASGVTYSWTGPNSFTSTAQNPVVSTAGTYTVTATASSSSATASVTITTNQTTPDLTATGTSLCSSTSATVTATSSVSGATYSWSGPGGFTSTSQNPAVSTAGTYTVIVTNPANGCTATQSVSVTGTSSTSSTFWLEDFTLANGTTSDTGATSWTTTFPGPGTFSVQNNQLKASFTAQVEGVWTSGVIDISNKSNVVISADLISGTSSSGDFLENADYIHVYYKLNGGAETLIYTDSAGIGSSTTGTASITVNSAALNGSTLQVVIRTSNSSSTEQYYFDNIKLTGTSTSSNVNATTAVSGPLTCNATTVTLSGSSSTSGVTYSWTGPNSFTSAVQNPVVSAPGNYTLTVATSGGCTGSATATVVQNITVPNLTVTKPDTLTCAATSVSLTAASSTTGAAITWTGFTSGQKTVNVSTPGKYYVTVRDSVNGCTKSDSVTVIQNITKPNLVVTAPAALTCATTAVNLSATSSTTGATITWTGFTSGQNTVSVSAPGKYYVTARSTTGCTTIDSSTVTQDISKPNLVVTAPATLTCATTAVNLSATSSTTGATITWTGFTSGQNTVSVSAPGKYYVTARSTTGCTTIDSSTVTQDISKPNLVVTAPAALTCATTTVNLSATSSTTGATITWTGFTSGQNTVSVSAPGKYYVTARSTTGCTTVDSSTVTQDISKPNLVVTAPVALTCATTAVNLSATSSTTGATITWTGFTSGQNTVSVSAPGKYYVTARSTTGCTTIDSSTVTQDISKPNLVVTAPAALTCATTAVNLSATSSTTGATITWTGFTSGQNTVSVSAPGKYYVTARSTTGCTSIDSATVTQDISKPNLVVTAPAALTCATTAVNLSATSSTTGATITWTGFTSGQGTVSVSAPGKYYVTARSTTGCTSIDSSTVTQDISKPNLVVTAPAALTCATTAVNLSATSSTTGATITWTGFTSGQGTVSVSAPGKYYVTARSTTGCTSIDSATVTQDISKPNLVVTAPATLTCATTAVNLSATSSTTGATITWTGFTSGQNTVSVSAPGKYYVTARSTTGCTTIDSSTVTQDISKPNLVVTAPATLTCATTAVNLSATSSTTGATITWTGFTSGQGTVSVSAPGKYYVTARSTTGCTSIDSATVTQDISKPNLVVTAPATLTCATTAVNLSATSSTTGATITWTGFTSGQGTVSVSAPGKYYVTARSTTGCTSIDSATVTQNISKPNLAVTAPASLTCAAVTVSLNATSSTSGATITWTGFTSGQGTVSISAPGKYYVTARSTNGCTTIDSATVAQDLSAPAGVTATNDGTITCIKTSSTITATSTTPGVTYSWTGPSNFTFNSTTATVTTAGTYSLVVTNTTNGCKTSSNTTVNQNTTLPTTVINPPTATLSPLSFDILTAVNVNSATYKWTLTSNDVNWTIAAGATSTTVTYMSGVEGSSGTFKLRVTNTTNGCSDSTQTVLTVPASSGRVASGTAAVAENKSAAFEYNAYPNPFTDVAYITFKSPSTTQVTVDVYSNNGVLEKHLYNDLARAGELQKLTLNASGLPAGIHYCLIKANGKVYTSRLFQVK